MPAQLCAGRDAGAGARSVQRTVRRGIRHQGEKKEDRGDEQQEADELVQPPVAARRVSPGEWIHRGVLALPHTPAPARPDAGCRVPLGTPGDAGWKMRESRQSRGIMTKSARPHQLNLPDVPCWVRVSTPSQCSRPETALTGSVAQVMQVTHDRGGSKAVDAKKVPASVLKPAAEPLQGKQPGEEGKNCAEQAGKCG